MTLSRDRLSPGRDAARLDHGASAASRLTDITLDAVMAGDVTMEDLRITPEALRAQAEIARDAGRPTLALNFERAAELVDVPQDFIMQVYELLRPGRARSRQQLLDAAATLRAGPWRRAHGGLRRGGRRRPTKTADCSPTGSEDCR